MARDLPCAEIIDWQKHGRRCSWRKERVQRGKRDKLCSYSMDVKLDLMRSRILDRDTRKFSRESQTGAE